MGMKLNAPSSVYLIQKGCYGQFRTDDNLSSAVDYHNTSFGKHDSLFLPVQVQKFQGHFCWICFDHYPPGDGMGKGILRLNARLSGG